MGCICSSDKPTKNANQRLNRSGDLPSKHHGHIKDTSTVMKANSNPSLTPAKRPLETNKNPELPPSHLETMGWAVTKSSDPPYDTALLLIDVQKDFHPGGSLAIPDAGEDALRTADLIRRSLHEGKPHINRIVATMDSHHQLHIAHPTFWVSSDGKNPDPFTIITSNEIREGKWKPRPDLKFPPNIETIDDSIISVKRDDQGNLDLRAWCIQYAQALEDTGRFTLCIWPEHCLIGSVGHTIQDDVREAMSEWCTSYGGSVEWVMKGSNLMTEMYSALKAEIPVTKDTDYNTNLLDSLLLSKRVLVVGQAMSHCVNHTVRDLVSRWPENKYSNIYVLKDCMSPVPGFEKEAEDFVEFLNSKGVTICSSDEVLGKIKS